MFSAELMAVLARRLDECALPLRAVATLKQWDAGDAPSRFREQPSPEHCEASWT